MISQTTGSPVEVLDRNCFARACFLMLRAGLIGLGIGVVNALCSVGPESRAVSNAAMPIAILILCAWSAVSLITYLKLLVWSPLPWLMLAAGVSFGFAPLLYVWGSEETIADVNGYFDLKEQLLFKTNLLNLVSFSVVCLSTALVLHLMGRGRNTRKSAGGSGIDRAIWLFLLIGLPVKYFLVVPYELGFTDWVLPGAFSHLSAFVTVALIALFASYKRGMWHLYFGVILFCLELVEAFISLAKWNIVITLLAVILGFFLASKKLRVLMVGFVAITFVYVVFLQDFIAFARDRMGRERSVMGTMDVFTDYVAGDRLAPDQIQSWWSRQSMANAQGFAIDAYDSGVRGHSFELILVALVPRMIWPDKPIITIGGEFNYLVNGNPDSASTPGVFGEAYWNGGWLMVIGVGIYVGAVFAWLTSVSVRCINNGELIFLPIVFFGIICGISLTGWFIPTYIGGLAGALLMYLATKWMVNRGVRNMARSPAMLDPVPSPTE